MAFKVSYSNKHFVFLLIFATLGLAHAAEKSDKANDVTITHEVKQSLASDPSLLGGNGVHVDTKDGVVNLSGLVDTKTERNKVVAMANQIPGVKSVNNGISIKNSG